MFEKLEVYNKLPPSIDYNELIKKTFVDLKQKVAFPDILISVGEYTYKGKQYPIPLMTTGEFSCIVAPSKSKKSFLKSALCASYIGGNSNKYFDNIKGHRKSDFDILDFDTEQSPFYAQKTFQRSLEMSESNYPNYKPYRLRALSIQERIDLIKHLIYSNENLKLVFIDGIADLLLDPNDLEKSNELIFLIMKWTEERNIHICLVIHSAFGSTKATGHLGSTAIKKCESVMMLQPTDATKKYIKVNHQYSRGYSFNDFHFSIKDNDALPYRVDDVNYQFLDDLPFEANKSLLNSKLPTVEEAFDTDEILEVPF